MGGATAVMYSVMDQTISGMVIDSAFSDLTKLIKELIKSRVDLPEFVADMAIGIVSNTIEEKTKAKISMNSPMNFIPRSLTPGLFIVAKDDELISPNHGKILYNLCRSEKLFLEVEGDHNSERPTSMISTALSFLFKYLKVDQMIELSDSYNTQKNITNTVDYKKMNVGERMKILKESNTYNPNINNTITQNTSVISNSNTTNNSKVTNSNFNKDNRTDNYDLLGRSQSSQSQTNNNNSTSNKINNNNNISTNLTQDNTRFTIPENNLYGIKSGMSDEEIFLKILEASKNIV
jgi:hypothetical protein